MKRGLFKGRLQCSCARCERPKGDRDSNAGWLHMQERGRFATLRVLCPTCAPGLLVAMDTALGGEAASHCRVISTKLLADVARTLRDNGGPGSASTAEKLEALIGEAHARLAAVTR